MDSTIIASFLSSLLVGIFAFVGVKLQTKANEKNISKQVEEGLKANIELLNKEHDIYKERKKWDLQFDFYKELYDLIVMTTETKNKDDQIKLLKKLGQLLLRSALLFKNNSINPSLKSGLEYMDEIIYDKITLSEEETFEIVVGKGLADALQEIYREIGFTN